MHIRWAVLRLLSPPQQLCADVEPAASRDTQIQCSPLGLCVQEEQAITLSTIMNCKASPRARSQPTTKQVAGGSMDLDGWDCLVQRNRDSRPEDGFETLDVPASLTHTRLAGISYSGPATAPLPSSTPAASRPEAPARRASHRAGADAAVSSMPSALTVTFGTRTLREEPIGTAWAAVSTRRPAESTLALLPNILADGPEIKVERVVKASENEPRVMFSCTARGISRRAEIVSSDAVRLVKL
mmetsp:Transcript_16515/g.44917  ORF Transcript_16515/g.44917 Transcript_16515/m.44917 type:complete len:242 (-) Transcript_16515:6832-7557(-)